MKIKILGSGGGEGFPSAFCGCVNCELVRKIGGKSIRSFSQTIIDEDLLIDFPADTSMHTSLNRLNLSKVENLLITHAHCDHLDPVQLRFRSEMSASNKTNEILHIHGSVKTKEALRDIYYGFFKEDFEQNVVFHCLTPYRATRIGKYTVIPLKANHAPELESLNFIIQKDGKNLLYLVDSGLPLEETWEYFKKEKLYFNAVILDGTMGTSVRLKYLYHMGFIENKEVKEMLIINGYADVKTQFVVTHLTHNYASTHESIEEIFKSDNIAVSYDGYTIEI